MQQPTGQGWMALGLFCLTVLILGSVVFEPTLQDNKLFYTLAIAIVSGAFCGGAVALYFNTTISSSKKDDTIKMLTDKVNQ